MEALRYQANTQSGDFLGGQPRADVIGVGARNWSWFFSGKDLVEDDPERKKIAGLRGRVSEKQLRRDVTGCSCDRSYQGDGRLRFVGAGKTKVGDPKAQASTAAVDHDVVRFDIPMDDASGVDCGDP